MSSLRSPEVIEFQNGMRCDIAVARKPRRHRKTSYEYHGAGFGNVVYFLSAIGSGAIKIGYSSNLANRIYSIGTSLPFELELVAVIEDASILTEREVHADLVDHKIKNEWYQDNDIVWNYMESRCRLVYEQELNSRPPKVSHRHRKLFSKIIDTQERLPHEALLRSNLRHVISQYAKDRYRDSPKKYDFLCHFFGLNDREPVGEIDESAERSGISISKGKMIFARLCCTSQMVRTAAKELQNG